LAPINQTASLPFKYTHLDSAICCSLY